MSFRISLPDGRALREEDVTQARLSAHRSSVRAASTPKSTPPMNGDQLPKLDGALPLTLNTASPAPTLSPGPDRRHVVFPDPVAFR